MTVARTKKGHAFSAVHCMPIVRGRQRSLLKNRLQLSRASGSSSKSLSYLSPAALLTSLPTIMMMSSAFRPRASAHAVVSIGQAVPILAHPYSNDSTSNNVIQISHCTKDSATGKLNIHFRWNGVGGAVTIKDLHFSSSQTGGDALAVGQSVLAIDNVPVRDSKHAARLVRDSVGPTVALTTCQAVAAQQLPPFTKMVAAPLLQQQHPGVVWDSTRDRCLVQISRVFAQGPFGGNAVRRGDIVLSVNGIAVSTVAAADEALKQQNNSNNADALPYTVLHVVDMDAYRRSILREMRAMSGALAKVEWVEESNNNNNNKSSSSSNGTTIQLALSNKRVVELSLDFATQHLAVVDTSKKWRKSRTVAALVTAFNERMEKRMRVLEEAVGAQAWNHSTRNVSNSNSNWNDSSRSRANSGDSMNNRSRTSSEATTSSSNNRCRALSEASLDLSTEEPTLMAASDTSSSSTIPKAPCCDRSSSSSFHDDEFIPLAAAEMEVFPLSALQTFAEREQHQQLVGL